jgi:hypothetical protein
VIKGGRRHSTHPYDQPSLPSERNFEKKRSSTNLTPKIFSRKAKEPVQIPEMLSPQRTASQTSPESRGSLTPRPSDAGPMGTLNRTRSHQSEQDIPEVPSLTLVNGNHAAAAAPVLQETTQPGASFVIPEVCKFFHQY